MNRTTIFRRFFLNDTIILLLVILNTLSVFVGGWYPQNYAFTIADCIFIVLFVIEAMVKIREYGWGGIIGKTAGTSSISSSRSLRFHPC